MEDKRIEKIEKRESMQRLHEGAFLTLATPPPIPSPSPTLLFLFLLFVFVFVFLFFVSFWFIFFFGHLPSIRDESLHRAIVNHRPHVHSLHPRSATVANFPCANAETESAPPWSQHHPQCESNTQQLGRESFHQRNLDVRSYYVVNIDTSREQNKKKYSWDKCMQAPLGLLP